VAPSVIPPPASVPAPHLSDPVIGMDDTDDILAPFGDTHASNSDPAGMPNLDFGFDFDEDEDFGGDDLPGGGGTGSRQEVVPDEDSALMMDNASAWRDFSAGEDFAVVGGGVGESDVSGWDVALEERKQNKVIESGMQLHRSSQQVSRSGLWWSAAGCECATLCYTNPTALACLLLLTC
jgi:hypothetical protein